MAVSVATALHEAVPLSEIFIYLKPQTILQSVLLVCKLWNEEAIQNNVWKFQCEIILGPNYLKEEDTKYRYQKYSKSYYSLFKKLTIENKYIGTYKKWRGRRGNGTTYNVVIWRYCGKMTYLYSLIQDLTRLKERIIQSENTLKEVTQYLEILLKKDPTEILRVENQENKVQDLMNSLQMLIQQNEQKLPSFNQIKIEAEKFIQQFLEMNTHKVFDNIDNSHKIAKLSEEINTQYYSSDSDESDYEALDHVDFLKTLYGSPFPIVSASSNTIVTELWLNYGLQNLGRRAYYKLIYNKSVDVNWMQCIKQLKIYSNDQKTDAQYYSSDYDESDDYDDNKNDSFDYNDIVNNYPLRCMFIERGSWKHSSDWNVQCGIVEIMDDIAIFTPCVRTVGDDDDYSSNEEEYKNDKYYFPKNRKKKFRLKYSEEPQPSPNRKYKSSNHNICNTMPSKGFYLQDDRNIMKEYYSSFRPYCKLSLL